MRKVFKAEQFYYWKNKKKITGKKLSDVCDIY